MRSLISVLLLFWLVSLTPAQAAESRKELGLRLDALTQRLMVLEERMLTGDPAAIRLGQRIDDLEAQLRNQVGENERLRFENSRQRNDIDALRRELDLLNQDMSAARKDAATARRAVGTYITGGDGAMIAPPQIADETHADADADQVMSGAEARFGEARQLLENGFFDQAYASLDGFVIDFPKDKLAGEALFWLGEIEMVRGNPSDAAQQYLASLKDFRKGKRAPDAMVKLAAAFSRMGDKAEACRTLKLFPKEYPKASEAVRTKADIEHRRAGCAG
ncbi:hypothetical protein MNBD_ALPHA06-184 [hydrothermal vent metagenome]|uniref:Cell division coordinator CpoB n=1 Tax=hydrothermal vent metagenome TaxID=652676 RepID=A0A3B0R5H4_9ZZZZ